VVAIQVIGILAAVLFFSVWMRYFRLGEAADPNNLSSSQFVDDIRDSVASAIPPATSILAIYPGAGGWTDYVVGLLAQPVPRLIWHDKPELGRFNQNMTAILFGRIGKDQAVMTYTMLGEAWYYFGPWGTFILFFLFGIFSKLFQNAFSSINFALVFFLEIVYQAFMQTRSTFYIFYADGLAALIIMVVMFVFLKLFTPHISNTSSLMNAQNMTATNEFHTLRTQGKRK
jgi:hypothetical protein